MSEELTRDGKTPETALEPFVQVDMTLHEYEHYRDLLEREQFTFCAFCGGKFPGEGTTEDLQAHMNICEQHPMAAQRATIQQLTDELDQLRQTVAFSEKAYLKEHDSWGECKWKAQLSTSQATIQQLEAQVKALESELKAWHKGNGGIVKPPLDPAPDSC